MDTSTDNSNQMENAIQMRSAGVKDITDEVSEGNLPLINHVII